MPKKKKSKKLKKTKVSKKGNKKAVKVLKLVSKSPEKKTSITGNDEKPETINDLFSQEDLNIKLPEIHGIKE